MLFVRQLRKAIKTIQCEPSILMLPLSLVLVIAIATLADYLDKRDAANAEAAKNKRLAAEVTTEDYIFINESRNKFNRQSIYYSTQIAVTYDDFIVERYKDDKITYQELIEIKEKFELLKKIKIEMENSTKSKDAKQALDKLKKESGS